MGKSNNERLCAGLEFPHQLRAMHTQYEVTTALAARIADFGYSTYTVGNIPNPSIPFPDGFLVHNWPPIWGKWYAERNFAADDPALQAAMLNSEPVTIREIRAGKAGVRPTDAGLALLDAAASIGRGEGLVVPIFGPNGYRGIVCFAGERVDLAPAVRALLHLWAIAVHNRLLELHPRSRDLTPASHLTERQIQVLRRAAQGLDDEAIARNLGISVRTVRFHFGNARARLRCKTRSEALATAGNLHPLGS
jgi:DNA-binding CsgD family transcriptional regulator